MVPEKPPFDRMTAVTRQQSVDGLPPWMPPAAASRRAIVGSRWSLTTLGASALHRSEQRVSVPLHLPWRQVLAQLFAGARERLRELLHQAHAVLACDGERDELVGGLYGVSIGAFFAGESMFHSVPNASKVALVALVDAMKVTGGALIDVQWNTPHLESLGAVEISRGDYLELLGQAVDRPLAEVWARPMNFTLLDN